MFIASVNKTWRSYRSAISVPPRRAINILPYGAINIFPKVLDRTAIRTLYKNARANDVVEVRDEVRHMITSFKQREHTVERQPSAMLAAGCGLSLSSLPINRYTQF